MRDTEYDTNENLSTRPVTTPPPPAFPSYIIREPCRGLRATTLFSLSPLYLCSANTSHFSLFLYPYSVFVQRLDLLLVIPCDRPSNQAPRHPSSVATRTGSTCGSGPKRRVFKLLACRCPSPKRRVLARHICSCANRSRQTRSLLRCRFFFLSLSFLGLKRGGGDGSYFEWTVANSKSNAQVLAQRMERGQQSMSTFELTGSDVG